MAYDNKRIEEIDGLIERLTNEKREIIQMRRTMTVEQRFAVYLHSKFCHFNHTDGCSWHYEVRGGIHDWEGSSHHDWLATASDILKYITEILQGGSH